MSRWPWPEAEVDYFITRATRVMEDHPRRDSLVNRFLVHLAVAGEPQSNRPVRALRQWAKKEPNARLRTRIESMDTWELANQEAGWSRRRGDIVRLRTRASWWEMRS